MTAPVTPSTTPYIPPPLVKKKARRKLMFFDRAKIILILAIIFGFTVSKRHAEIPYATWGGSFTSVAKSMWVLFVLAGLEVLRQIHYWVSEKTPGYNHFWSYKFFGSWDRFWSKRNPWFRFRMQRLFKGILTVAFVFWVLSNVWNLPFLQAISDAPGRITGILFGSRQELPFIFNILMLLLLSIGQFVAIFWFMSRGGTDVLLPDEVETRFKDVWGQDKVLDKVTENIAMFDKPEEIEAKGGHVPGGILLWGPPGTGKTLIAKAIAGETGKPFVFVDPGAFQAMFMGVGIMKVKALYKKLRKLSLRHGGVIVFFDEADSLGNRGVGVAGKASRMDARFDAHSSCDGLHFLSPDTAAEVRASRQSVNAQEEDGGRFGGIARVIMGGMGMGGGGMGTLQSILTEMSGLEKPRGFLSRRIRKFLTMPAKMPPKYRMLTIMATNAPDVLDPALLRPGRLDRLFKVDYPTLDGRIRTFEGYLAKVKHVVTKDQISRLALMSPSASGAVIKDTVNEALIVAMRAGRDTVQWQDLLSAKSLKTHGMPDEVHPMALERHAVALHEAGHAVAIIRLRKRFMVDVATIEPRGTTGGFVSWVPSEEPGFPWRKSRENDVIVSLASLAAERHFYRGDNSVGVGGDLQSATSVVRSMEGRAAMGSTITSFSEFQAGDVSKGDFDRRVEERLQHLYGIAMNLVVENELYVMAIAHALEEHHTITGEDIEAIFAGTKGPLVDGTWYHTPEFRYVYERFHNAAVDAHEGQTKLEVPLPKPGSLVVVGSDGALQSWGGAASPDHALPSGVSVPTSVGELVGETSIKPQTPDDTVPSAE
jgi:cell division protease FtsH